jgi:hypothetical protein
MSTTYPDASRHLFKVGMQYYIAGRAAACCRLIPIAGNLLHHAVEMLFKGELSKTLLLEDTKKQYGHLLVKTWNAFKALHSGENLAGFDQLVADLDRFEKIRYPDEYINDGALISLGWGTLKPPVSQTQGPKLPEYVLYVNEVDDLIARLFKVCRINPPFYWGTLNTEAVRFLEYENRVCAGWVPQ